MHGRALALIAVALAQPACERREPPAPLIAQGSSGTVAVVSAASAAPLVDAGAPSASASAEVADAASADDAAVPELLAPDGGALPQTEQMPSLDSPTYKVRVAHLWRAIVEDRPELADDAFFPLVAYRQVKAIAKPDADYEHRLLAAYHRDLHAYHKKLGPDPEQARFIELAVPTAKAAWVKPGDEYNKIGYDRVYHSKIRYQRADGKEGSLLVLSMISWRGEWYVVHVAGIK